MTQKERFEELAYFGFGPNVMRHTRVCVRCGQVVQTSADICSECGAALPAETLFDRYKRQHRCCPSCDTVLSSDAQYCPNCGKQICGRKAVTAYR